jgi:hypothetical protein
MKMALSVVAAERAPDPSSAALQSREVYQAGRGLKCSDMFDASKTDYKAKQLASLRSLFCRYYLVVRIRRARDMACACELDPCTLWALGRAE